MKNYIYKFLVLIPILIILSSSFWNAFQYPSGVYLYNTVTNGFSGTKMFVLIK